MNFLILTPQPRVGVQKLIILTPPYFDPEIMNFFHQFSVSLL